MGNQQQYDVGEQLNTTSKPSNHNCYLHQKATPYPLTTNTCIHTHTALHIMPASRWEQSVCAEMSRRQTHGADFTLICKHLRSSRNTKKLMLNVITTTKEMPTASGRNTQIHIWVRNSLSGPLSGRRSSPILVWKSSAHAGHTNMLITRDRQVMYLLQYGQVNARTITRP